MFLKSVFLTCNRAFLMKLFSTKFINCAVNKEPIKVRIQLKILKITLAVEIKQRWGRKHCNGPPTFWQMFEIL